MPVRPVYYWVSCLFYEHLKDEPVSAAWKRGLTDILEANKRQDNFIVSSVITPLEVIPEKLIDPIREAQFQALFDGIHMQLLEISENTLRLAREIRSFYYREPTVIGENVKLMDMGDAVHLATAAIYGVAQFQTRDNSRKGTKIPLLSLYRWSDNPQLCGRFDMQIHSPTSSEPELFDADPRA